MNDMDINDKRSEKEFRGITFSKYKKSDAKTQLLKSISGRNIEPACYWSAEFICAGHYVDLWEIILLFVGKNIHLGNPKLPFYIELRYNAFKEIVSTGYVGNELKMRNNKKIRKLFAEIVCVLCYSHKRNTFSSIKIEKSDFSLPNITNKLKAPDISYAQRVFKKEDPKDLFIAVNEFAYNLSDSIKSSTEAFWWLEWILAYESICKKEKKNILLGGRRYYPPVAVTAQTDIIWIIWDVLLYESTNKKNNLSKLLKSLLANYCIRYTSGVKRKRKFLIYFAISLLTIPCDFSINIIKNEREIETIKTKIDLIYKQIKKNEMTPNTAYLFNKLNAGNLEKTITKLEILNKLPVFLPRKN